MAITDDDIAHLARLANIALDASDRDRIHSDLNGMLALIQTLQAVDTTGVKPLTHTMAAYQKPDDHLRDDTAAATSSADQRAELMRNAPAQTDGLFLVPTVLD